MLAGKFDAIPLREAWVSGGMGPSLFAGLQAAMQQQKLLNAKPQSGPSADVAEDPFDDSMADTEALFQRHSCGSRGLARFGKNLRAYVFNEEAPPTPPDVIMEACIRDPGLTSLGPRDFCVCCAVRLTNARLSQAQRRDWTGKFKATAAAVIEIDRNQGMFRICRGTSRAACHPRGSQTPCSSPPTPPGKGWLFVPRSLGAGSSACPALRRHRTGSNHHTSHSNNTNNSSSNSNKRVTFAAFCRGAGKRSVDVFGHARGWDFSKPVTKKVLKAGTEVCQWQTPGLARGAYFAPCGSSPSSLNLADHGTGSDGSAEKRIEPRDPLTQDAVAREGRAARVADDWSVEGRRVDTTGGARQFLVDPAALSLFSDR